MRIRADPAALRPVTRRLTTMVRPRSRTPVWLPGVDPLRVLVAGAGLATGYGVATHAHALTGHIADALQAGTGRGVLVQPRTAATMPSGRVVRVLRPAGASTFPVVVLAGGFLEAPLAAARSFSRQIDRVVAHLTSTGPADLRIVVLGLPTLSVTGRVDRLVRARIASTNHWTRDAVEHHERARFVPMPPGSGPAAIFSSAYYAAAASVVVEDGLHDLLPG